MEAAVVSAAEGAAGILLRKLGGVLAEKYVLVSGVREEVQKLKDELETMTAWLRVLATATDDDHNEMTRTWMKQVRELAYDAEDCLDIFGHRLGSRHGESEGCVGRLRNLIHVSKTMNVRHNRALEIRNLKTRALEVSDRRRRYEAVDAGVTPRLNNVFGSSNCVDLDRRFPTLNSDESQLVGIDTDELFFFKNKL